MRVFILIFCLLSVVACDKSSDSCVEQPVVQPFNLEILNKNREFYGSCKELEDQLTTMHTNQRMYNPRLSTTNQCQSPQFEAIEDGASSADQPTNLQVSHVDEADRVKISKNFIFYAKPSWVEVISRQSLEKIKVLSQKSERRAGLFVYDEKLIVLQRLTAEDPEVLPASSSDSDLSIAPAQDNKFQIDIYDVSKAPALIKTLNFIGKIKTTRLSKEGALTIVSYTNMFPHYYDTQKNQQHFRELSQKINCDQVLKAFSSHYDPILTTAMSIDLNQSDFPFEKVELQGRYDKIYQADNLYLTKSYGHASWGEIIESSPIGNLTVKLSPKYKHWKIDNHFSYPGRIMGSWSFHEKDAYLFVATDTNRSNSSQLNVINTSIDQYEARTPVAGLAPGETIRSVRYTEDFAYIVTFRTVDPLFIIDIRNPEFSKIKSELKIPGYSSYLHTISGDRLVGVGYSGDTFNLQLSLFDVSNPVSPQTLQQMTLEGDYTSSNSQTNHHSFFYNQDWQMLAVPVRATSYGYNQSESYGGAHIYNVEGSRFEKLAFISHQDWFLKHCSESWGSQNYYFVFPDIYSMYRIDDRLMSFSDIGYRSHDPSSPELSLYEEEFHEPEEACRFYYDFGPDF